MAPLCSSIAIMILSVVGMRVVFSLPIEIRANWIFRVVPLPSGPGCMAARRRSLYALSVVPVCVGTAALLFAIWPWDAAVKHLAALALLGAIVAELCLHGTQKLPFTCSYLPGKSNFNITLLLSGTLGLLVIVKAARMELDSFNNAAGYVAATGLLMVAAGCSRWSTKRVAKSPRGEMQFDEAAEPAIFALDLHRDGVTPIAPPNESCAER